MSETVEASSKDDEMLVLGSILNSSQNASIGLKLVKEEDFFDPKHKTILKAISEVFAEKEVTDTHLVIAKLKEMGGIEHPNATTYVLDLAQYAGTAVHIEAHCENLKKLTQKRQLISLSNSLATDLTQGADESKIIEKLKSKIEGIEKNSKFSIEIKERNYDLFEQEHKSLFSSGGLIIGYEKIDDQLYFAKGDFVVVQAMSNHGKSTFMLQLAHKFLLEKENQDKDPMCIFITYESMPLRIEEKWVNLIGHGCKEGVPIQYVRRSEEKYLYADRKDFQTTIATYNRIQSDKRMHILEGTQLERLSHLIDLYKEKYPHRTIILFLDYIQIIDTTIRADGWEKIKEIAYQLESLAIKKEIIVISACQVNENRQPREGRDIYNAATTVIDIFNHSHVSLKTNKDLAKLYKPQIDRKNVCTFTATKQKHGSMFEMPDCFLFNGYGFEVNVSNNYSEKEHVPNKAPQGHTNYN